MTLRTRLALAVTIPAILLNVAFGAAVFVHVRDTATVAFDEGLVAQAARLAALIERDDLGWESDADPTRLDGLLAWSITPVALRVPLAVAGPSVASVPPTSLLPVPVATEAPVERGRVAAWTRVDGVPARIISLVFRVPYDGVNAASPPNTDVRIVVVGDRRPLKSRERLLLLLLGVGSVMVMGLAAAAGAWASRRIVGPLDAMARAAESVVRPTPDAVVPRDGSGDEVDRLAAALNTAFQRHHDAWIQQARFTGDAAHELRTPLAVLRTTAEVALRRERSTEAYQNALTEVVAASTRLAEVVDGLLLLARVDNQSAPPTTPVDLSTLAAQQVERAQNDHGRTIETEFATETIVRGEAHQLEVALRNLIHNALQHSEPTQTVSVRVRRAGDSVLVEVEDTGEGIPTQAVAHVFERFYRVDGHRGRNTGGAGLGLAIVDAVTRAHGGRTDVRSAPGQGATFRLTIPSIS